MATAGDDVPSLPDGRGPVDHIAISATGYDTILSRLEEHGIDPMRNELPSIGVRQLYVLDPNGVRIELNVRDA